MRALAENPRYAGTPAESAARAFCAGLLREKGYSVAEEGFTFSDFPARWGPALSALLFAALSVAVGFLAMFHHPLGGLAAGVAGTVVIAVAGRYLIRRGVLDLRFRRTSSVNLVASPKGGDPRIWLAAHIDSKSQTIPMLLRVASVIAFAVLFTSVMVAAAIIATLEPHSTLERTLASFSHHASVLSVVALVPLMICFIGNDSHGALDNASGVAALLLAAGELRGKGIGIVITSGEELALAGARAFVRDSGRSGIALNCDTIDGDGEFLCMSASRRSPRLGQAIDRAAARIGIETRRGRGGSPLRPMLPGVLADNVAFTDGGWESFTLSRGNLRTLARVHTSRDTAGSFDGAGIAQAALFLVAIVEELT